MNPILQTERSECGLACIAMVANAHGMKIDLHTLRQRFSISSKGATLAQITRIAHALGFNQRAMRGELEDLVNVKTPAILHWDLNHFVVLEKATRNSVTILDPALGRRTYTYKQIDEHFTGIVTELEPNSEFKPVEQVRKIKISELTGKISGLKATLITIFVFALAIEAVALLSPVITQFVVDGALVTADKDLLFLAVIGGGVLTLIHFALDMGRGWVGVRMNQQMSLQWTSNLLNHLLRLPVSYFEKRHLGDITSRFSSIHAIRGVLTNGAIGAVLDGIMAVATLCMMLLYSIKLSLVVILALVSYMLMRAVAYGPFRRANEERIVLAAKENSYFIETIRAVQPLKLFGRIPERLSRWQNMQVDVQNRDTATQKMNLWFSSTNTMIFGIEGMAILYIGGLAVLSKEMSLGMLLAFMAYKGQFVGRASALINLVIEIKMLSLHAQRVADIALEAPEKEALVETDTRRLPATVELRNVSFRYAETEPWVLKNVNLKIEAGQSVAIIGSSGCGKSTLIKLILGVFEPTEGTVLIGGVPLAQLGMSQARELLGCVMQDDPLLSGSIYENITCFDTQPNQDFAQLCAQIASIDAEIQAMPMGYQTLLGDMGSSLSGGQKQRLLLARALYKRPKILLLDEATSHLDLHNERIVNDAIKAMQLTRISVAHRSETIAMAQRLIQLDQGTVVQDLMRDEPQEQPEPSATQTKDTPLTYPTLHIHDTPKRTSPKHTPHRQPHLTQLHQQLQPSQ